jgi:hypothetical protein
MHKINNILHATEDFVTINCLHYSVIITSSNAAELTQINQSSVVTKTKVKLHSLSLYVVIFACTERAGRYVPSDGLPSLCSSPSINCAIWFVFIVAHFVTHGAMSSHCTRKSLAVGQTRVNSFANCKKQ